MKDRFSSRRATGRIGMLVLKWRSKERRRAWSAARAATVGAAMADADETRRRGAVSLSVKSCETPLELATKPGGFLALRGQQIRGAQDDAQA